MKIIPAITEIGIIHIKSHCVILMHITKGVLKNCKNNITNANLTGKPHIKQTLSNMVDFVNKNIVQKAKNTFP